jgi:hypothetical protein
MLAGIAYFNFALALLWLLAMLVPTVMTVANDAPGVALRIAMGGAYFGVPAFFSWVGWSQIHNETFLLVSLLPPGLMAGLTVFVFIFVGRKRPPKRTSLN